VKHCEWGGGRGEGREVQVIGLILIKLAVEIIENYHANILVVFRKKHCSTGVCH